MGIPLGEVVVSGVAIRGQVYIGSCRRAWPAAPLVALAQKVQAGERITASWALTWLRSDPQQRSRTPATRCPTEFEALFRLRYDAAHPGGLRVPADVPRIRFELLASSFSRRQRRALARRTLPNITLLHEPTSEFRRIANDCCDALDRYSRYCGRHGAGDIHAFALLPRELAHRSHPSVRLFARFVEDELADRTSAIVNVNDLLDASDRGPDTKLTKKRTAVVTESLERLGLRVDPDPRFGGRWRANSRVVLCRAATHPVLVRASETPPGFALPAHRNEVTLDMTQVKTKRAETHEVADLLNHLFAEQTQESPPCSQRSTGEKHSRLLERLRHETEISRRAFGTLANALGLMPNAALDEVNEAAFDKYDAPLLEGEDPMHIDQEILKEMLA